MLLRNFQPCYMHYALCTFTDSVVTTVLLLQPEDQPNPLFRHLWSVHRTPGECALCQFIARHRVEPQEQYNTCLFNEEW
jgi:hypothetical protein